MLAALPSLHNYGYLVTALFPAKLKPQNPSLLSAPSNLLPVEGSWLIKENIIVILEMRNY